MCTTCHLKLHVQLSFIDLGFCRPAVPASSCACGSPSATALAESPACDSVFNKVRQSLGNAYSHSIVTRLQGPCFSGLNCIFSIDENNLFFTAIGVAVCLDQADNKIDQAPYTKCTPCKKLYDT